MKYIFTALAFLWLLRMLNYYIFYPPDRSVRPPESRSVSGKRRAAVRKEDDDYIDYEELP